MKKLKILIADDEEILQDIYEMILETEFSCQTIKVASGNDAISKLQEINDIDLIISDYSMPNGTGGKIYLFNKEKNNIPFFLFSGGELQDYNEFNDFKKTNPSNHFFNKPFVDEDFINAVSNTFEETQEATMPNIMPPEGIHIDQEKLVKIKLSTYITYNAKAEEVFIKLNENRFTKITKASDYERTDIDQLEHYLKKGIEYVYIERDAYELVMKKVFNLFNKNLLGEKKSEEIFEISGLNFSVSYEGLKDIGLTEIQIERANQSITDTVDLLLDDTKSKAQFQKLCLNQGFAIGHSMIIMYIAARITLATDLKFSTTMSKICAAAFYHDMSLFESDNHYEKEPSINDIDDERIKNALLSHPTKSADFLPESGELILETKRIILEHHELPNGDGYPKKLRANQIAPLSCLFILSQEITFCLIRNNFSKERLSDFLINKKDYYNQGNFIKFYKVAEAIFVSNT